MNDAYEGRDRSVEDNREDPLSIVPVPALVAVLLNREREKGSPLTEAEVLETRDNAACIAMPSDVVQQLAERRGYFDIDPERVWEEWQDARTELAD